jgi:hypothetical protein
MKEEKVLNIDKVLKKGGYNPPPKNPKRPDKPTPAPPPKKGK